MIRRVPRDHLTIPAVRLDGARVTLRPPAIEDWPEWADVRSTNRDHLTPYEPAWPDDALSRNFYLRRLERQAEDWRLDAAYCFLIRSGSDGQLIGGFNINNVCRGAAQFASVGYWLAANWRGQGLMREAARLAIDFGFDRLRLHRFNAGTLPGNQKSRAMLLQLGFREEGLAPSYIEINGSWQDHILYGLPVEARHRGSQQDHAAPAQGQHQQA